uniref:non-specific serine/threonine protein kinase n=1 Tax=Manihot esculenta TaxID=3983 RepID=A0A2C9VHP5_MANES
MGKLDFLLLLFLSIFAIFSLTHEAAITSLPLAQNNLSSQCPMDLNYVFKIPWNKTYCQNYQPSKNNTASLQNDVTNEDPCCRNLLHLFGIGLAQHLKETSLFELPSLPTSVSCLQDYQTKLSSLSLPDDIVSHCFDPMEFVITPNLCAHVQTTQDWVAKLGKSTVLDSACRPNLEDLSSCSACVDAGLKIQSDLISIDGNSTHGTDCLYFTILYAAGIVNEFGPESEGAITCIFVIDLESDVGSSNKGHLALVFGLIGASVAILLISSLLGLYFCCHKKWRKKRNSSFPFNLDEQVSRPRLKPNTGSIWFKLPDLEKATENFSQKNFIGRGGFGLVYKGILSDGTMIAVKKIIESDILGDAEFCNEVEIHSNLKHRNLVPLRGCCVVNEDENYPEEGSQRYLVYDYMPNGNLDDHLFPSFDDQEVKKPLTWPQRKSIILDVAKGLAYLHCGVKPAIYHRDIKATNILLDADMRARVADFGLAKQSRESQSHLSTRVAGTRGYLAPEYALYGQVTEKTFLISDWVWSLVKAGKIEDALDVCLVRDGESSNTSNGKAIMESFLLVGVLCAHVILASRPTILDALKMLEGDIEVPTIPNRPMPLSHPSTFVDFTISSAPSFPQVETCSCKP